MIQLDAVECRVLGSLVEKSLTTPDQYPLTFNSLLLSCNQKTSREPVMNLDPEAVDRAVRSLVDKTLAERVNVPGSRVPKFRHRFENLLGLATAQQTGVLCVLLLRGAQTPGEIKGRTDRLCEFTSTAEVESVLQDLATRPEGAVVARLPKQPGQKETRYQHLYSGEAAAAPEAAPTATARPVAAPAAAPVPAVDDGRLEALEKRLASLEETVRTLERRLAGPVWPKD